MSRKPDPRVTDHHQGQTRAAVSAWCAAYGRGEDMGTCYRLANEARIAAGGDPSARGVTEWMVAAAAISHAEWLYAPLHRRLAWEERHLRAAGCWPPPYSRREWPPIPPLP